jgi:hypothetical protein
MAAYSLDKYTKMSTTPSSGPLKPSAPSSGWKAFAASLALKNAPYAGTPSAYRKAIYTKDVAAILSQTTPYFSLLAKSGSSAFGKGGDPDAAISPYKQRSDAYIAACLTKQYKQAACATGVYGVNCTEGASKGAADDSRVAALAARFRMKQRTTSQKFADFTESRRKAISLAHGCSYEEKLVTSNVVAARSFVLGAAEKSGTCVRYAIGQSPAEAYMVASVDKQYKAMATSTGIYGVQCCDGTTSGMAETKRVLNLSARFRANQMSAGQKAQQAYDARKYARTQFRACNYETAIFENFPAVAASMRPTSARY